MATALIVARLSAGILPRKYAAVLLGPYLDDLEHPAAVEVVERGDVAVPSEEALFVHAHVPEILEPAPPDAPLHGARHDPVGRAPADLENLACLRRAPGFLQHPEDVRFEGEGEAHHRIDPRNPDGLRAMQPAVRQRDAGAQDGLQLHRVQDASIRAETPGRRARNSSRTRGGRQREPLTGGKA